MVFSAVREEDTKWQGSVMNHLPDRWRVWSVCLFGHVTDISVVAKVFKVHACRVQTPDRCNDIS